MGLARCNGIDIAYEAHGEPAGIPLLLVQGLGLGLVAWHPDLVTAMVRRGYRVVLFDNRDVGLSTHLTDAPAPDPIGALRGDLSSAAYTLETMADDTAGLLDALDLPSAHVLGVSMGGMIAQTLALNHPGRVRSLTSIMSTSGDRAASRGEPQAVASMLQPAATTRDGYAAQQEVMAKVIGSTSFAIDLAVVRERALLSFDRGYDAVGAARQFVAIYASGDRTPKLSAVRVPALVVHGTNDPLMPVAAARITARALPAAELFEVEGMGHDLPREVWDRVLDKVDDVVWRGEHAAAPA